jgi:thiamine biosynthesis lipoprotein
MTQRLEFHAMGSRMIAIVDTDAAPAELENLPGQFGAWEQVLSRFRNDSELCELNRRAGKAVHVSRVLWDVFEASQQANARTGGMVNPLIMDALIRAGYDRSFDEIEADDAYPDLAPTLEMVPCLSEVVADADAHTLCLPAGAQLDFGGIAKGWAAQQAVLGLSAYGPALVSAGGDIAVSGRRADGEPWEIGVEDPLRPGAYIESVFLERGGVATSGRDYHHWRRAGSQLHHIIDPRTGLPAETDVLTATVIAPDAILAEALAKAVLISGGETGLAWLESDDALAGLLVLENGQKRYSRNLGEYL